MSRKGVSPLIAAVLIIAFTMAIAGVFSEWSLDLVDQSTGDAGDHQDDLLDCSGNNIEFLEVNHDGDELEVMIQASGGELGETLVTVYPSLEENETTLDGDRDIETVSFDLSDVDEPQETVRASSIPCDMTSVEELE